MKDTVILAQNDENLKKSVMQLLKKGGYDVVSVQSGEEVVGLTLSNVPDIVICGGCPDMKAYQIVGKIRAFSGIPFFALGKNVPQREKVLAFESGADDFIEPPFSDDELLARIKRAVTRTRFFGTEGAERYSAGGLEIDFSKRCVRAHGENIRLTPVEYKITELLCRFSGRVLPHEYIMKNIWGPYVPLDNKILRVNVTNIRKKIERDPSNPELLKTESGVGYVMAANNVKNEDIDF